MIKSHQYICRTMYYIRQFISLRCQVALKQKRGDTNYQVPSVSVYFGSNYT